MTPRVMSLDMLKLRRAPKCLVVPIQHLQPLVEGRVTRPDVADIALEMLHIDNVEAYDRREEPDIGLGDIFAVIERSRPSCKMRLRAVERFEECGDGFLVSFLGSGEARLVDAVVDVIIGPVISLLDVLLQIVREENHVFVFLGEEIVKLGVEHADDFRGLIADDRLVLLIVKGRDGEAALVFWVSGEVDIAQVRVFGVERVGSCIGARDLLILFGKAPT